MIFWVECILLNFDAMHFEKMQRAYAGVSFCRQINHLDSNPRRWVCEKTKVCRRSERRCSCQAYIGAPMVERVAAKLRLGKEHHKDIQQLVL
jgi:hypothetical protein